MKTEPNEPISSILMQQTGENTFRAAKPGEKTNYMKQTEGLTKREYFAAMAMQGYLAGDPANEQSTLISTAEWSVRMADELIKSLNKY